MARSQLPVSKDGVSIDTLETARQAKLGVDRDVAGEPIHACGKVGARECPCWTCTSKNCAACLSSLY
jgi:hypothetical protein